MLSLCLGLTLAGCGRKGSLDAPRAPATPESAEEERAAVPVESILTDEPESDSEFFLDFLIR
ncbi:lipoprotein [Roseibium salinum]|nr:lipoprotein [Roseibium salinum]